MTRRRTCRWAVDSDRHSLVCRLTEGHDGLHRWWSQSAVVQWDGDGRVIHSDGIAVWRPGVRYVAREVRR